MRSAHQGESMTLLRAARLSWETSSALGTAGQAGHTHNQRILSYVEALREATDLEMGRDESVVLFGLDVDDPKAIQGTVRGLLAKYGPRRGFGTPLSEDAMAG